MESQQSSAPGGKLTLSRANFLKALGGGISLLGEAAFCGAHQEENLNNMETPTIPHPEVTFKLIYSGEEDGNLSFEVEGLDSDEDREMLSNMLNARFADMAPFGFEIKGNVVVLRNRGEFIFVGGSMIQGMELYRALNTRIKEVCNEQFAPLAEVV